MKKETTLKVVAIFRSIDGEYNGFKNGGELSTFIRLAGCNLRCRWCDTKYAQVRKGRKMTISQIVTEIGGDPKVTITGGEPLVQKKPLMELVGALLDIPGIRREISIETNGSIQLPYIDCTRQSQIKFIVDYKLPSSGMESKMSMRNFLQIQAPNVIKFVLANKFEYGHAVKMAQKILTGGSLFHRFYPPTIVFSPAVEDQKDYTGWPALLAALMIRDRLTDFHYSLQIHKVLWPYAVKER